MENNGTMLININKEGVLIGRRKLQPEDRKNFAYALQGLLLSEYYMFGHRVLLDKKLIGWKHEYDEFTSRNIYDSLQLHIENNKYMLKDQSRYLSKPEISHIIDLIFDNNE